MPFKICSFLQWCKFKLRFLISEWYCTTVYSERFDLGVCLLQEGTELIKKLRKSFLCWNKWDTRVELKDNSVQEG